MLIACYRKSAACVFVFLFFILTPVVGWSSVLPNFILKSLAMHFCEYKVTPFVPVSKRRTLCGCAWSKITVRHGEKGSLMDHALSLSEQSVHWRNTEARQIQACAKREGLSASLRRAERAHPKKLAMWIPVKPKATHHS